MYEKIKADISNEYYLTNYPNDGQRFVAWYLRNIHNLDTYETKDCITDGAGDKQIDAIYIDNQSSTIYIIQGKFYAAIQSMLNRCVKYCLRGCKSRIWSTFRMVPITSSK